MISQRRKRTKGFSSVEKNLLIHCVKNHGSIWDLTNPKHSDINAIRADWEFIAETLDKTGTLLSISTDNYVTLLFLISY